MSLTKAEKHKTIVAWWEGKRLLYNIILISIGILMILGDYDALIDRLLYLCFWMFGANLLFCLGYGVEGMAKHYGGAFPISFRWFLFISATLFSVVLTFIGLHT